MASAAPAGGVNVRGSSPGAMSTVTSARSPATARTTSPNIVVVAITRGRTIATQVADRLAAVAGGDASPWSSAAAAYSKDMAAADEAVQAILLVIPADRRTFLTSSDGLAYFTQRYDLTPRPGTPNVDAGVLVIDVDSLGPVGSATATNAGLLTDTASRIAAATTGQP
jgi:hypothetical protein